MKNPSGRVRRSKNLHRWIGDEVRKHDAEFGPNACLSSILRAWSRSNAVTLAKVGQSAYVGEALEHEPAGNLEVILLEAISSFDLKTVEVAFENLIDAERKKKEGVVYTPNYIIDFILKRCLSTVSSDKIPTVIDPACGSGGFLIRAARLLADRHNTKLENIIENSLFGVDLNPNAVKYSQISLELLCLENGACSRGSQASIFQADTLKSSPKEIAKLVGASKEGFDVVATNPPYVKLQNLDEAYRKELIAKYPEFSQGSFSLAMLFLIAGYRLLNENGVLGYITQNNLFTSLAAVNLRDFLQNNNCLNTIVDFGHKQVFDGASAYTCLVFLDRHKSSSFKFYKTTSPSDELSSIDEDSFDTLDAKDLKKEKWRLAASKHLRNLEYLESCGTPLGDATEIRVGFATLKDSVFLLNGSPEQSNIENEICKPAIKIAKFAHEDDLAQNKMRIIHPYHKVGKRWVPYSEAEMKDRFPNAFKYLSERKRELLSRSKGKKLPPQFFEWGRTQGMEANGPKLLTKTFNQGPNFMLDQSDSLFCNGYSVRPLPNGDLFGDPIRIEVLQKILNSIVMDYYAKLTSFQIEGNYQCFQKNFIERLCLPALSAETQEDILQLSGEELECCLATLFRIPLDDMREVVNR